MTVKYDWTAEELQHFYDLPLLDLVSQAQQVHRQFHIPSEIQVCSLISIKTGGCPENCKYCPQSAHYKTPVNAQPFMQYEEVLAKAKAAIAQGATRICLGAAWREVRDSKQFDEILNMVNAITELGVEVCCTLGMMKEHQAQLLKKAGLYAYNHNVDTSENFYKNITTTRTYQERLDTLKVVEEAGLSVCCGGILGMGESEQDRLEMLLTLCTRNPHPESVPINRLIQIPGTPLENQPPLSIWDMVRTIAVARIVMPQAMVRLSAGRKQMTDEHHALCFLAGANSIHVGEKLLTTANVSRSQDEAMFELFQLSKRPSFASTRTHA